MVRYLQQHRTCAAPAHPLTCSTTNRPFGGRSRSSALGSQTITLGGKNIGGRYRRFRDFVDAYGGGQWEDFGISTSQIRNGKIYAVEGSKRGRVALDLLGHAHPADVARLVRYARALRADSANRFLDGPAFARITRRHDPPLSRTFRPYITQQLIRPMTIRMNGAEPNEAFLGNFGTNLSLVLDSFEQLVDGFDPLFESVAKDVSTHQGSTVTAVHTVDGAVNSISCTDADDQPQRIDADIVILAVPAGAAARLIDHLDPSIATTLRRIPYYPVGVVVAEYDQDVFGENARALVFPTGHAISNAGAYGKDARNIVRYTFSGHAARSVLDTDPDTTELLSVAERNLRAYMPFNAAAVDAVSAIWAHGLCAYGPRHAKTVGPAASRAGRVRGLALAGDYVSGASIEACFHSAEQAVISALRPTIKAREV